LEEREAIIVELQKRLASVEGNNAADRNPESPPDASSMPVINFYELDDNVVKSSQRGGYPVYTRVLNVVIEPFIQGEERGSETKELQAFCRKLYIKLYEKVGSNAPNSLGGLCSFVETAKSRVLRPATGPKVAGIGIAIAITYLEDTGKNI